MKTFADSTANINVSSVSVVLFNFCFIYNFISSKVDSIKNTKKIFYFVRRLWAMDGGIMIFKRRLKTVLFSRTYCH